MIILIADDDRLIRFSIRSMLGDILGDAGDVFLEAKNGTEMVNMCRKHQPDIAFVDIRMPNLNGLDAIEQSREHSPGTEYVIVSGYSDFEYAQKGIRLGVNEYLLKPVDEEELHTVADKLSEKLKKRKDDSNAHFQLRVMSAFSYYSTAGAADEAGEKGEEDPFLVFMLRVRAAKNDWESAADSQRLLLDRAAALGREIVLKGRGKYAAAGNGYGTPCIVFQAKEETRGYIRSQMGRISARALNEGKDMHSLLWFESGSLAEVCERCEDLEQELCLLIGEKPGAVCPYGSPGRNSEEREFLRLTAELTDAWAQADGVACREIMNRMWREYRDAQLDVNLKNLSEYCSFVTGCEISGESLKEFCRSFVENSESMYDTVRREDTDVIDRVSGYIRGNYMKDISISQIAEQMDLTANYLSTVFHQRTGKRFVEYLAEIRVEAAKKLLIQNESASVQDIALMVGYGSARHFSSIFQKQAGMTPSAYRREHAAQKNGGL